jgi:hypothetical protein
MIEQLQTATEITNGLSGLFTALSGLLVGLSSLIGAASVIAKFLPPPEGDGFLAKFHKWVNAAAMNSGYAENNVK